MVIGLQGIVEIDGDVEGFVGMGAAAVMEKNPTLGGRRMGHGFCSDENVFAALLLAGFRWGVGMAYW